MIATELRHFGNIWHVRYSKYSSSHAIYGPCPVGYIAIHMHHTLLTLPGCIFLPSLCSFSTKARTSASIILRGANDFMCDEMERSLHDALCVVKRVLESKSVVPGGGAVEAALSIYLENYATSMVRLLVLCYEEQIKQDRLVGCMGFGGQACW